MRRIGLGEIWDGHPSVCFLCDGHIPLCCVRHNTPLFTGRFEKYHVCLEDEREHLVLAFSEDHENTKEASRSTSMLFVRDDDPVVLNFQCRIREIQEEKSSV